MSEENNPRLIKIGELLISVGRLTTGDLTEAIQISKRMGVPIGRVLVMSGCVTEPDLQQALRLQSLIKDGLVDLEMGIKALEKTFKEGIDIEESLKAFNWVPQRDSAGNKLGDLLIDSSIVTSGQLERALEASFQSGMPLGGTLVLQGVLSAQMLPTVLHTQEQIRDGKMNREEAVQTLKTALMFWAKADQSKQDEFQSPIFNQDASNKIQMAAQAMAQEKTVPSVERPPIAPDPAPPQAVPPAAAAAPMAAAPISTAASSATAGVATPNVISLLELLKLSGFCTQQSIDTAIVQALNDNRLASKLLLAIGFLDADTLNTYVKCQALIARGVLRTDQVLYALNSIRHRKITFEQAIAELGVQAPA